MPIDNQIEIPPSFIALYLVLGRDRPNATHEVILARYELCEDMACMLTEHAQKLAFDEDMEQKVLRQCHEALLTNSSADPTNLNEQESLWVMHRLAELLDWAPLVFEEGA
jgi:hypothetical protein